MAAAAPLPDTTTAPAALFLPAARPHLRVIEGGHEARGRYAWVRRVPLGLLLAARATLVYGEAGLAQRPMTWRALFSR